MKSNLDTYETDIVDARAARVEPLENISVRCSRAGQFVECVVLQRTSTWVMFRGICGTWAFSELNIFFTFEGLCTLTAQQMLDRLSDGKDLLRFDGAATRAVARRGVARWYRRGNADKRSTAVEGLRAIADIESEADFNDFLVTMPIAFEGIAASWARYTMPADLRELCNVYWPRISTELAAYLRRRRAN